MPLVEHDVVPARGDLAGVATRNCPGGYRSIGVWRECWGKYLPYSAVSANTREPAPAPRCRLQRRRSSSDRHSTRPVCHQRRSCQGATITGAGARKSRGARREPGAASTDVRRGNLRVGCQSCRAWSRIFCRVTQRNRVIACSPHFTRSPGPYMENNARCWLGVTCARASFR